MKSSLHYCLLAGLTTAWDCASAQDPAPPATTLYVDIRVAQAGCEDYRPAARACGDGEYRAFPGIAEAAAYAGSGDTVLIQPGVYSGGVVVARGGDQAAPVIFKALADGVIIDGSAGKRDAFFINEADHVIVDGLTVRRADRAGLRISNSHHVTVRNSTFLDNGSWGVFTDFSDHTVVENCEAAGSVAHHAIYISNSSDHPVIRGNRLHHNAQAGLHMNGDISMGGDGIISNALIENNEIWENGRRGGSGINLDGVTRSVIRNNLLYANHASGISLYRIDGGGESHDNQVLHNTVLMARDARWALNLPSTGGNKVFNNILLNSNPFRGSILVEPPVSPGFESDYNVVTDSFSAAGNDYLRIRLKDWQSQGYGAHSLAAEPSEVFADVRAMDFGLKPGSPAVDAGKELDVPADILGRPRAAGGGRDIGAFEGP